MLISLILHLFLGAAILSGSYLLWLADPTIAHENRLLENLQAGFLTLALAAAAVFALRRKAVPACLGGGLVVFFLTLLLREVHVERFDLPALVVQLGSGIGRNLLLAVLWGAVLFAASRNARRLKSDLTALLRSLPGCYLLAGVSLYLGADLFDRGIFSTPKPLRLLWEEALEVLASLVFALSALTLAAWPGRFRKDGVR